MRKTKTIFLFILLAIVAFSGCASPFVKYGEQTPNDILLNLGAPTKKYIDPSGIEIWSYEQYTTSQDIDVSPPILGYRIVNVKPPERKLSYTVDFYIKENRVIKIVQISLANKRKTLWENISQTGVPPPVVAGHFPPGECRDLCGIRGIVF